MINIEGKHVCHVLVLQSITADRIQVYEGPSSVDPSLLVLEAYTRHIVSEQALRVQSFQILVVLVSEKHSQTGDNYIFKTQRNTNINDKVFVFTNGSSLLLPNETSCPYRSPMTLCYFLISALPGEYTEMSVLEVNHTAPNGPDCSYFGLAIVQVPQHVVVDRQKTATNEPPVRTKYAISSTEEYISPANNKNGFSLLDRVYQKYLLCDSFWRGASINQSDMFTGEERNLIFTTQAIIAVLYAYTSFLAHPPQVSLFFRSTKTQALPTIVPYKSLTMLSQHQGEHRPVEIEETVNAKCIKQWEYLDTMYMISMSSSTLRYLKNSLHHVANMVEYSLQGLFYKYILGYNSLVFSKAHTLGFMYYENMLYCALSSDDGNKLHAMISKRESRSIAIVLEPGDTTMKYAHRPYHIDIYVLDRLKRPVLRGNSFGNFFIPNYLYLTFEVSHEERKEGCDLSIGKSWRTTAMERFFAQIFTDAQPCEFYVLHVENSCCPQGNDVSPYINKTASLVLRQYVMTCFSVTIPLRAVWTFYFFAMVPLNKHYKIGITNGCNCSSSQVSLNITNLFNRGHKVYFENITQNIALGPLYTEQERLQYFHEPKLHQSIQFEWHGVGESCSLLLEYKTLSPVKTKTTKLRHSMVYKTRKHHVIPTRNKNKSLNWFDTHAMCDTRNESTGLVFFSQDEMKHVASYLFRQEYYTKPSIILTGWQLDTQV